ncbi:MAG: response regulator [Oscillatoriophycideae cyanobacterium NC_groundwater_1537_Pr4_S-0.65um_50_18]|nr:response regulator [Oscillatoriophycideae cyanobacterium NC_groundwater_1537_Pr4_S-0.65um_50_18]
MPNKAVTRQTNPYLVNATKLTINISLHLASMCKILIVDDFVDDCLFLQTVLEIEDYTVALVGNGWAAIDMIQELRPNVVLLDILLPDMIGYSIVERIRQNPNTCEIRIVLTTASSILNESEAMASGADAFIRKPLDPDYVLEIVKKLCDEKKDRQKTT